LQTCFLGWIQVVAQVTAGQVVAIDGKTLRRSYDRRSAKAAIHRGSAWATHNRVVVGQLKTEEKSNEITAIPEWLKVLESVREVYVRLHSLRTIRRIEAR
jgi:hypothetical protein